MDREETSGFNARLWRRYYTIALPYWRSEERGRAAAAMVLIVALLGMQTAFSVLFNQETGEFTSALAAGDATRFWSSIWRYAAILVAAVPVYGLYNYARGTLGLRWRSWLTDYFLAKYFSRHAFYRLNSDAGIDNPDQRISEDINAFTQQSLFFATILLGAFIQLGAFLFVLWAISPGLVYFLIAYALLSTVFTASVFGKRLIGLNFVQLKREADFRFGLVRVREYAEPIAFFCGESREMQGLQHTFSGVFSNFQRVLRWQFWLNLFQYAHGFLTLLIPTAIVASDVLSGHLEVGRAVQAAGAFTAILFALTVIIDHFESLSRFSAGVDRLYDFLMVLRTRSAAGARGSLSDTSHIHTVHGTDLEVRELSVGTPNGTQQLVQHLSLTVEYGRGLLIVGSSGSGKSSLLRVIAGLWRTGTGDVIRPASPEVLFLPQQPYLPLGDLRCQLTYPATDLTISDDELHDWLALVNLPDLADRFGGLGETLDWNKVLSVGEQQRLSFARALIAKPRYLLLDESTSALDAHNEECLYSQLARLSITPISVSHHKSVLRYHHQVLEIPGDGSWKLHAASGFRWAD